MLAQALVEFGLIETAISGLVHLRQTIWVWFTNVAPLTWLIVGGVFLLLVFLWSHRPQRL
jgi:hypothetical protein